MSSLLSAGLNLHEHPQFKLLSSELEEAEDSQTEVREKVFICNIFKIKFKKKNFFYYYYYYRIAF